jgi:hypothetical protein
MKQQDVPGQFQAGPEFLYPRSEFHICSKIPLFKVIVKRENKNDDLNYASFKKSLHLLYNDVILD